MTKTRRYEEMLDEDLKDPAEAAAYLNSCLQDEARLVSVRGAPRHLRSDNGPEFVSRAILRWLASPLTRSSSTSQISVSLPARRRGACGSVWSTIW